MSVEPRRGIRGDHKARLGRQAPLSGRQGAVLVNARFIRQARPVDTIADARRAAKKGVEA